MPLIGAVELPSDKSVAHRAMLFAAIGDGTSTIEGFPSAEDPQSTRKCVEALGIPVVHEGGLLRVEGRGLRGFRAPTADLDCGNSGTTMRLLAGLLAGQNFPSVLTGDASLSSRPMRRVAAPLTEMGARLETTDGHAPLRIDGAALRGVTYRLPVASAQVKSCVLLAGLLADGETTVIEPVATRDHTERMLGLEVLEIGTERHLTVTGGTPVPSQAWKIPRDFSAAAFFLVAGSIVPGSALVMPDVGLNPTRTALLDVLRAMGADLTVEHTQDGEGEPIGHIGVRAAPLHGVVVEGATTANLIDEIPILAVAAALAEGETTIRDAAELRVKETDRIAAICANLRALGADVTEHPDGFTVRGGRPLRGAPVRAFHDHRIAMAMGVAGLVARGSVEVDHPEVAAVSFPDFWEILRRLQR